MAISKSFSAVGAGTPLQVKQGQAFNYAVTGTFVGTIVLERSENGGQSWEPITSTTTTTSGTHVESSRIRRGVAFRFRCSLYTSGTAVTTLTLVDEITEGQASSGGDLELNAGKSQQDLKGNTVKLNSITNRGTDQSFVGFQSKPSQGVSTAHDVIGAEVSPRLEDGVALSAGSIIGMHIDAYLKGTSAGTIAGDVRGLQVEIVSEAGGTRAITGDVTAIRIRSDLISGTITGKTQAIKIEKPASNAKQYDAVLTLASTTSGVWSDSLTTATASGFIKVLVNGQVRYLQLYSGTPS
jgi:hypothetical protein